MVLDGTDCQGPDAVMDTRIRTRVVGYALRLRGIVVESCVGVSDAERAAPQALVVAVDLELPGDAYPDADELAQAADYAKVIRIADASAQGQAYRLLETFALGMARRLSALWPAAERVRVAVTKARVPVVPTTNEATVEVTLSGAFG